MKKKICLLILLFFSFSIFSQQVVIVSPLEKPLWKMQVAGLKKIKSEYVIQKILPWTDLPVDKLDMLLIEKDLMQTELFEQVNCSVLKNEENEDVLLINVLEKKYFHTIPFALFCEDDFKFGAYFFNENAFCKNEKLLIGAKYQNESFTDWKPVSWQSDFVFNKEAEDTGLFGSGFYFSVAEDMIRSEDQGGSSLFPDYKLFSLKTGFGVNEKLNTLISVNSLFGYTYDYPHQKDLQEKHCVKALFGFSLCSETSLFDTDYLNWFPIQKSFDAVAGFSYSFEDKIIPAVNAKALFQIPVKKRFCFEGKLNYFQTWNSLWNLKINPIEADVLILSKNFESDLFFMACAGFDAGIFRFGPKDKPSKQNVLSAGICFQSVLSKDRDGDFFFDSGFSLDAKILKYSSKVPNLLFSWSLNFIRPLSNLFSISAAFDL